jgi:hypothetical protein
MTAEKDLPKQTANDELTDTQLDQVNGGIIAILIGMLTPSIPIPPPQPLKAR